MNGLASLGSGSRGNGTLVRLGETCVLVDCGFTLKQTEMRLRRLDTAPGEIAAIIVTHEHADHARGVAALAQKYAIPVFASYGTLKASLELMVGRPFDSHQAFDAGAVSVTPVPVPHDCREPTQFVLEGGGARIGVISDLGRITAHIVEQYCHCDAILMESNHDRQMLVRGRYPERLKRRIASEVGHLSNEQAVGFLEKIGHPGLNVVIGHVSEENNHRDLLEACFEPLRSGVSSLSYATQSMGMNWTLIAPKEALAL
ncbi:MAG: MBL fold metallo-hydrolase [Pseudomonadales bacterium]|nr:MBL fold metallo-hydrolase [Pseudomonadales bacterium]MDP6471027.1 MBL fold metallo-hydrolase [Pseudomonadales bacterium]MDP6825787.1 MBL fold metallo-hydrolase [Pseudomonadales bacterium]MDP6970219.1 MBL fold metallo-hydrolase [Pseudomonadales bacterium]